MTLHRDWSNAKKTSKAFFKDALEAKKEKLEKEAKGDDKAKDKAVDKALDAAGLRNVNDIDKYFVFKEDFGPNLDKLEEAATKSAEAREAARGVKGIPDLQREPKIWEAFGKFCKRTGRDELHAFIDSGWKMEPRKAYDLYIRDGAREQININASLRSSLDAAAADARQLASQGPALLVKCRDYLSGSHMDIALEFARGDDFHEALGWTDTAPLLKKVRETIASYRKQIDNCDKTWKGIKPDFCYPLETELTKIEYVVDKLEKGAKR